MKKAFLIGLLLSISMPIYSIMSPNMVWEVEPVSGNDQNGCGWDTASSGVDKTTWTAVSLSGLTSAGAGSTILYSGALASDVGNVVNITGGTNFTPNRYRITAVSVGSSWTTDKAVTTGAGASGTGFAFGPCQSLTPITTTYIASNSIYVKNEALIIVNSSISFVTGNGPAANTPPVRLIGYGTSRGDNQMVHFQMNSGTPPNPPVEFLSGASGISYENLWIDCNGVATSTGILINGSFGNVYASKISSCTSVGIGIGTNFIGTSISSSEFTSMGSGCLASIRQVSASAAVLTLYDSWVHDNQCPAILTTLNQSGIAVFNNIFANNTGATTDCLSTGWDAQVLNNVFYKCGRDGLFQASLNGPLIRSLVINNIFDQNGRYGFDGGNATAGTKAGALYDGNAYYNNATAARNDLDDTTTNKINGVGPYTNRYDVILTTDPFVNAAANDFRLNSSLGGGGSLLFKGVPQIFPVLSQTGYPQMGAILPGPMPRAIAR